MTAPLAELDFTCVDAHPDLAAAGPTISLRLRITETTGARIYALALRCQLRIEPVRRSYDDTEAAALQDLFGERARWGATLKPLQLGFLNHMVPGFRDKIDIDLALPCSYDVDVAANKYLYGLADGEVPLLLLFSGTVLTHGPGGVSVQPVPWHKETAFRLPVSVWRTTMELHFPGTAWARLELDTFAALQRCRTEAQLRSLDETVRLLLKEAGRDG